MSASEPRPTGLRGIPGFCFDIDGQWWNGHGPDSGCVHCDWKPPESPKQRCLAHLEDEPCGTCAAYIAAGL